MEDPRSTSADNDWPDWQPISRGRTIGQSRLAVAVSLLALVVSLVAVVRSEGSPSVTTATPPPSQPVRQVVTGTIPIAIDKPFLLDLDQLSKDNAGRFAQASPSQATDGTFTSANDPLKASFSSTDGAIVPSAKGQSLCLVTNGAPPALACFVVTNTDDKSVELKITTWRIG